VATIDDLDARLRDVEVVLNNGIKADIHRLLDEFVKHCTDSTEDRNDIRAKLSAHCGDRVHAQAGETAAEKKRAKIRFWAIFVLGLVGWQAIAPGIQGFFRGLLSGMFG